MSDNHRIEPEATCARVHQPFQQVRCFWPTSPAVRCLWRRIGDDTAEGEPQIGDPIGACDSQTSQNRGRTSWRGVPCTEITEEVNIESEQSPIVSKGCPHELLLIAAVIRGVDTLGPRLGPPDRPLESPRQRGD